MFPCSFCDSQLFSEVDFTSHMKFRHKTLMTSTCYCPYQDSVRSFNNFYTYKRHLSLKHNNVDRVQQIENESNDEIFVELNDCQSPSTSHLTNESKTSETSPPPHLCLSVENCSHIINHRIALFVADLYADLTLPRLFVSHLIDKLNDLYGSTFISMLKQKYNCEECKKLPSDLNLMFNTIQYAFDNFSTEHKTLKYFENLIFLIKPQSIVVSASLKSRFVDG